MADELHGRTIAIIAADGVEQPELEQPRDAITQAGGTTELLSIEPGEIQAVRGDINPSVRFAVDKTVADASVDDYDGVLLPGGVANPDTLRQDPDVIRFLQDFFRTGKPVGVICHGPWTLVEADVVRGKTMTSWPSLRTDLTNAGATWVDEEVHVDGALVTSRKPDDLPAFCDKLLERVAG
jgi:protease I